MVIHMARHSKESGSGERRGRGKVVAAAAGAVALAGAVFLYTNHDSAPETGSPAPAQEVITPGMAAEEAARLAAHNVNQSVACLLTAETDGAMLEHGPDGVEKIVKTANGDQLAVWMTRSPDAGTITSNLDYRDSDTGESSRVYVERYVSADNPMMAAPSMDESVIMAGPGGLTDSDVTSAYAIRNNESAGSIFFEGNEFKYELPNSLERQTLTAGHAQEWQTTANGILAEAADAIGNPDCLPR